MKGKFQNNSGERFEARAIPEIQNTSSNQKAKYQVPKKIQ